MYFEFGWALKSESPSKYVGCDPSCIKLVALLFIDHKQLVLWDGGRSTVKRNHISSFEERGGWGVFHTAFQHRREIMPTEIRTRLFRRVICEPIVFSMFFPSHFQQKSFRENKLIWLTSQYEKLLNSQKLRSKRILAVLGNKRNEHIQQLSEWFEGPGKQWLKSLETSERLYVAHPNFSLTNQTRDYLRELGIEIIECQYGVELCFLEMGIVPIAVLGWGSTSLTTLGTAIGKEMQIIDLSPKNEERLC